MSHVRAQLRAALKTVLTGLAKTGDNVYPTRLNALARKQLPALRIYTPSETASRETLGPAGDRARSVQVLIECVAAIDDFAASEDIAAELDAIAAEVEAALDADPSLGGLIVNLDLESTGFTPDREGDMDVGVLSLGWRAELKSRIGAPEISTALKSGALAVVKVGGTVILRLRSFSVDLAASPIDFTSSDSAWAETDTASAPSWSAEIVMTLDNADAAQAALAINAKVAVGFWPQGEFAGAPARSGTALVTDISESGDETPLRTVRLTGDGALT